jgi:hypothetical protein
MGSDWAASAKSRTVVKTGYVSPPARQIDLPKTQEAFTTRTPKRQ